MFTNEGAPRYRVMKASVEHPERDIGSRSLRDPTPCCRTSRSSAEHWSRNTSTLPFAVEAVLQTIGAHVSDIAMPGIGSVTGLGGGWDQPDLFFGFQSFTVPPSVYHIEVASGASALELH